MTKKEIIKKIIEEQKAVITNIEKSISMYNTTSDLDEEDTMDPEDFSHQTEAKEMEMRMQQKMKVEKLTLDFLESHKDKECSIVEIGALIETNAHYLYIGASVPPFSMNNKEVLSMSEKAPILNTLRTKKIGDKVQLGDHSYTILNIS